MNGVRELVQRHEALKLERATWERDWRELARHFLPRKCRLEQEAAVETNRGGLRGGTLDSTAFFAMRDLAAGLHGGMTSPARPWFSLTMSDKDLARRAQVRQWLDKVSASMRGIFNQSNFYNAIHNLYLELGTFGTAFMFALHDDDTCVRFTPLTVGEYCVDTNDKGRVDTVFRTMHMTLRQIMLRFGSKNVPEPLRQMYAQPGQWTRRFPVVHAVYPRKAAPDDGQPGKPFVSVYYLEGFGVSANGIKDPCLLSQGGFDEFPGFGVRWDVTGNDVYGKSPGMDTLPSSIMVQQMTRTMLVALQKEVDPPMVAPEGMENISLLPGSVNYVNSLSGQGQQLYPAMQVRLSVTQTAQAIAQVQEQVRDGLFNSLFRMLLGSDRRQITATEVAAREQEKLILIGPVLERLHSELFIPLIDRVFNIMRRANLLPEWPEELSGAPLKVEFVSVLAQAQKMVATGAVEQFAGFVGQSARLFPEMLDAVNPDAVVDNYAEYLGVEGNILRAQEEREKMRQERAQAGQRAESMRQAMTGMDALKNMTGGQGMEALAGLMSGAGAAGGGSLNGG